MASFKVEKGGKFAVEKGIQHVTVGTGWDSGKLTKPIDIDAHAFGCIAGPSFYNNGSHAVTYANSDLIVTGKQFATADGSMIHTGDNKTGAGDGDDEQIQIYLEKLPAEITEIMVFITIYEAKVRGQHFGLIENAYVALHDADTKAELCRYNLRNEFDGSITIQVGSLVKAAGGTWSFNAVGAGTADEALEDILAKLS